MTTDQVAIAAHAIADLCAEKAVLYRANQEAVQMLTDALHALRHGSQNVTDEFLDRTIESLTRAAEASQRKDR